MNTVVRMLDAAGPPDRTDAQLLERFVRARDPDAFAAVVRRHGPMVLGACRRVLRNAADADDAFQATFLVLARKAGAVTGRDRLGPWLHGVALNAARKLLRANARRAAHERAGAASPELVPVAPDVPSDALAALDEELAQLPERYRAVLLLCDLAERTRKEAAAALGCPEGTVAGRLARARKLLATRLAARGFAPAAGGLAVALPPAAVAALVRAVNIDGLAHDAAVSPLVADLTERVVKGMFATKLQKVAAAALCCGLALACAGGAIRLANAQPAPGSNPSSPPGGEPRAQRNAPLNPLALLGLSEPPKAVPDRPKTATVVPLRELDPGEAARVLGEAFGPRLATVAPLPDDKSLLVYTDAKTLADIHTVLLKMGEPAPKKATAFRLKAQADPADVARALKVLFGPGPGAPGKGRPTFVAVPGEPVVLVHATEAETEAVRKRLAEYLAPDATAEGPARPPEPAVPAAPPKQYTVKFQNVPWGDALDWYAKAADLTLVSTVKPTGTVTLTPGDRRFTLAEVTDLLNEALMQQKFILVRRQTTFFLHPADEKLDPAFVPRVELKDLAGRGRTEVVEVAVTLLNVEATAVKGELQKLLTPFGEVVLAKGKQLILRETASNLDRLLGAVNVADPWFEWPQRSGGADPRPKLGYVPPGIGGVDPHMVLPIPDHRAFPRSLAEVPWASALEWYAQRSGLARVGDTRPLGTFTFAPPAAGKEFTLAEATDIINDALLAKGWLLVRDAKSFAVVPSDRPVDPKFVPLVQPEELERRGRTELVEVVFPVPPNVKEGVELAPEVKKLLGPFGTVRHKTTKDGVLIQDVAGNLVKVRRLLAEREPKSKP